MSENFLLVASKTSVSAAIETPVESSLGDRESLKILVIGSRRGVTDTIHILHRLRFAEVREWSPLLPTANPGEVMSILSRYILPE